MSECETCSSEHTGEYGSGRFCTVKCARSFATKCNRQKISDKVRMTLTKQFRTSVCPKCAALFKHRRNKKYCSRTCAVSAQWDNPLFRARQKAAAFKRAKLRYAAGDTTIGWQTRSNCKPSYPESIAIDALNKLGVKYEREFRVGRYFVDFVVHEQKLAIEIDGQQHLLPERQAIDQRKDTLLAKKGWTVVRIQYPDENIKARLSDLFT